MLSSAAYLARYQNQTPWSRRCLGKAVIFKRWACEQVEPGNAGPHPDAKALLLDAAVAGALQSRRFSASTGEHITLCELSDLGIKTASGPVFRLYGT